MTVLQWIRSDAANVTQASGTVSAWLDRSGNGHNFAQGTAAAQPAYNAADSTLNNRPTVTGDGSNDVLLNTTVANGNGTWVSGIIKTVNWAANRAFWGSNAAPETGDLLLFNATPSLALYGGVGVSHTNSGLPVAR